MIIEKIKSFFRKNTKKDIECLDISVFSEKEIKKFSVDLSKYEKTKNFLIIDDNFGIVSILLDDLKDEVKKRKLQPIIFYEKESPIKFIVSSELNKNFKVDFAIIDLIFGCIISKDGKNQKLNGVDILCEVLKKNPNAKFIFFTGNRMNSDVTENAEMIKKFKDLTGKSIFDYIIFKGSDSLIERNKKIKEKLFGEN